MHAAAHLSSEDRARAFIVRARLPGGRHSGGILLEEEDHLRFWLLEERSLEPGDVVRFAGGRWSAVVSRERPSRGTGGLVLELEEILPR